MSPSECQELVEFLTGQFGQIERQFAQVDQCSMSFRRHMEERLLEVNRRFDRVDERFREVLGHFDEARSGGPQGTGHVTPVADRRH